MMLTLTSYQTLSQDTSKIEVISYNNKIGIFIDSASANKLAHKLELGDGYKKGVAFCDSSLKISDSINVSLDKLTGNLNTDIFLANKKTKVTEDKFDLMEQKYKITDDERKRARRQRFAWGGIGFGAGVVVGIIAGILVQ